MSVEAKRAALVVAAHEFSDPRFQRLRSPVHDVDALAGVLGDEAVGGFDVQAVVNQPSSVVQQELERFFSDRTPDDLLLLYFSCHGVKDPAGRLYFATSNTTFDLLRSTGVSASFVSEQMEYSRSKRIVLLLDCCYSGAFLKGFRARGDDSVAVDQLEGRGRAVITASRATEYAFEADELAAENAAQPSVFTGAIVEGLATGKADVDGDGLVTVDELYDYVYDAVRGQVAGQTPGRWIHVEGNLVVARNPRAATRPAAQAAAPAPSFAEPIPVTAPDPAPSTSESSPPEAMVVDRSTKAVGWLAGIGACAVLLAPFLRYLHFADYSSTLAERDWFALGAFLLCGLSAFAAYCLLRTGRPAHGTVVLAALLPVAVGDLLVGVAEYVHDSSNPGVAEGWFLHTGGLFLLAVAGVLALARARRLGLGVGPFSPSPGAALFTVAALGIGAMAAIGWGNLLAGSGNGLFALSEPAVSLVVRLTSLVAVVTIAPRWVRATSVPSRAFLAAALLLTVGIAAAFLLDDQVTGSEGWAAAFAILAAGALAVPALSTLVRPARYRPWLLGTWAAGSAAWVPTMLASDSNAELLGLAFVTAGAFALVLHRQAKGT
ncbi:MAG: caspase family protein [Actinomycetota bacterium]|nr:caspase family protein [Actinomycetota bacterium]